MIPKNEQSRTSSLPLAKAKALINGDESPAEKPLTLADIERQIGEMICMGCSDDDVSSNINDWSQQTGKPPTQLYSRYEKLKKVYSTRDIAIEAQPLISFTDSECQAAMQLANDPDIFGTYHEDFNRTGYLAGPVQTKSALLVSQFSKLNLAEMGTTGTLKGTQTVVHGSSAAGKTAFVEQQVRFVDCTEYSELRKFERQSSSSEMGFLFSAGEDGTKLKHKLLVHDELNPSSVPNQSDKRQEVMWQLTTSGAYHHRSSEEGKGKKRQSVTYSIYGPVHHIATSVTLPLKWDEQWRNRTYWIEIRHTQDSLRKVAAAKLGVKNNGITELTETQRKEIWRGWNCFLHSLRSVDPSCLDAFAGIDMPFLERVYEKGDKELLQEDDCRRIDLLIVLIAAHAVVKQHYRNVRQREDGRDVLIATEEDYNEVVEVFEELVPSASRATGRAHEAAFLILAKELDVDDPEKIRTEMRAERPRVTRAKIELVLKRERRTVDGYLAVWRALGLVDDRIEPGKREQSFGLGPRYDEAKGIVRMAPDAYSLNADNMVERIAIKALELCSKSSGFLPSKL